jgi:hypothetical protein
VSDLLRYGRDGRRGVLALCAAALFVLAVTTVSNAGAAPVARAACDPVYGCTTTTTQGVSASCALSGSANVSPGETVVATLDNVPPGTAANLTLDGATVASGTASSQGSLTLTFTVPSNAAPGTHQLLFVGGGVLCDPTGGAGLSVLGAELSRGSTDTPRSGGDTMARTGMKVALYLAIALVLVIIGWTLVQAARRRRRRSLRARNDVRDMSHL